MPTNTKPITSGSEAMPIDEWRIVRSSRTRQEGDVYIENPDGATVEIHTKSRDIAAQSGFLEYTTTATKDHLPFKMPGLVKVVVSAGSSTNVKVWVTQ